MIYLLALIREISMNQMKIVVALTVITLSGCIKTASTKSEPEVEINQVQEKPLPSMQIAWRGGIFKDIGCVDKGQHGDHHAHRRECSEFKMIEEVSELPIKVGLSFGIEYLVLPSSIDACYEETRVLTHPPMRQPDGKVTTEYSRSYKVGDCPDAVPLGVSNFTWFIEYAWEAVVGEWEFKVLVDGKPVISTTFVTY